jgi:hypothetical protein
LAKFIVCLQIKQIKTLSGAKLSYLLQAIEMPGVASALVGGGWLEQVSDEQ